MFCPNCGNQMKEGAVFCSNCGYRKEVIASKGVNFNINKIPFVQILCLVVIVVLLVKNLFLSGSSFKSIKLVTAYSEDTTIDNMETVKFGSYPQSDANGNKKEPIEWIVLDRQSDKTLLLSKYIIDCKCYNDEFKDVTWENCTLRNWLNNDFYNSAFSSSEQNKILTTNIINSGNSAYGTIGGNNTNDKIFCLSIDEVKKYFNQNDMSSFNKRLATKGTNYAKNVYPLFVIDSNEWYGGNSAFLLRSPGFYQDRAAGVGNDGSLNGGGISVDTHMLGVRPALWIEN